jgi:hypothetical protein
MGVLKMKTNYSSAIMIIIMIIFTYIAIYMNKMLINDYNFDIENQIQYGYDG